MNKTLRELLKHLSLSNEISDNDVKLFELTDQNVGVAGDDMSVVEYGNKHQHVTEITIEEFTQAIAGAALGFGKKLYDFPAGGVKVTRVMMDINIAAPTDTIVGELGVGTIVAVGAIATLGAGHNDMEDIVDGFANTITSSGGADTQAYKEAESGILDGSSTAKDAYFNVAATWTASEDLTISGKIVLFWDALPDFS